MEAVGGQANLLEIVLAFHAVGRLANFLHGRQQEADEDRDDGDDDEQLDEREAWSTAHSSSLLRGIRVPSLVRRLASNEAIRGT